MAVAIKRRFEVFNRDRFTCRYCGRSAPHVKLECEHVLARVNGGTDLVDNLVTSCFECNRGKATKTATPPALPSQWPQPEAVAQEDGLISGGWLTENFTVEFGDSWESEGGEEGFSETHYMIGRAREGKLVLTLDVTWNGDRVVQKSTMTLVHYIEIDENGDVDEYRMEIAEVTTQQEVAILTKALSTCEWLPSHY